MRQKTEVKVCIHVLLQYICLGGAYKLKTAMPKNTAWQDAATYPNE